MTQFFTSPNNRIMRDDAGLGPRNTQTAAEFSDLTGVERAAILARAVDDPLRQALLASQAMFRKASRPNVPLMLGQTFHGLPADAEKHARYNGLLKELPTIGGAGGGATTTFQNQFPALAPPIGVRIWVHNYSTTVAQTVTAKVAACPNDTNNGSALTWSAAVTITAPVATNAVGSQSAPGIGVSSWIPVTAVARTDTTLPGSSQAPLFVVRSLPSASGAWGFAGATGVFPADEIFTAYGREYASGSVNSDAVATTATAVATTRHGFYYVCFVEFMYAKPVVSVGCAGDSITRGQTNADGSVGFLSLAQRVCMLKASQGSPKLWSPHNFSASGQLHTYSFQNARAYVDNDMLPRYVIHRAFSVNDTQDQATANQSFLDMGVFVDAALKKNVTPVLLTTYGTPAMTAGAIAILQDSNTKLLALRDAGAIVIDAAGLLADANLVLLAKYQGADAGFIHPNDLGYTDLAALIADALI